MTVVASCIILAGTESRQGQAPWGWVPCRHKEQLWDSSLAVTGEAVPMFQTLLTFLDVCRKVEAELLL